MPTTKARTKKAKKAKTDHYQLIADQLLALLEAGTKPWTRDWIKVPYCNARTGHRYRGLNPVLAEISAMSEGYQTTLFVGFNQAKELGLQMIAGSKATYLRVGGRGKKEEIDPETNETVKKFYSFSKMVPVFNLDCFTDENAPGKIAELIQRYQGEQNNEPRIADLETLIDAQQAKIVVGGSTACYMPGKDQIHMPPYQLFSGSEGYYATLVHELIHRTGHESRLNRASLTDSSKAGYAFEELVADMGSAFVCSTLGISPDLENHASYLAGWMKAIKDDNRVFFRAYALAKQAADLLLENAGLLVEDADEAE